MNISCQDEQPNKAGSIVLSLWLSLSGLAAATGNAVVFWLLYKNRSLRTISNRFLASLSVADFLVGLVIDPFWIVIRRLIQPPNRSILWNVIGLLWIHTTAATTFNLCCVSVDRFIAIRFPFRYHAIVTKRRCYTAIIVVWLISLGLPFTRMSVDRDNRAELWLSFTIITFLIPLFLVTFCYICIFKAARKQFGRILGNYDENIRVRNMQNVKAIKTVSFVLGVYIITWMPSLVLQSVHSYYMATNHRCKDIKLNLFVWPWVETIALTSSAINPWIYYFRNEEFRQAFRRTFHWLPCRLTVENAQEHDLKPDRNRIVRNGGTSGNLAIKETEL